jgi:hypothetical protein
VIVRGGVIALACACEQCRTRQAVLRAALEDAADYREGLGGGQCDRCDKAPDGLCDDHLAELARAAAYRALARELEGAYG